jgi:hypothetical protein
MKKQGNLSQHATNLQHPNAVSLLSERTGTYTLYIYTYGIATLQRSAIHTERYRGAPKFFKRACECGNEQSGCTKCGEFLEIF